MDFQECVLHCFEDRELVAEFVRLTGCTLRQKRRDPIEVLIDQTCGHEPPAIDEKAARRFIQFVCRYIWVPLVIDQARTATSREAQPDTKRRKPRRKATYA